MAAGTATLARFDAGDTSSAITSIQNLGILTGDKVISWRYGSRTYVVRFEPA